jgi:hypothetical protein
MRNFTPPSAVLRPLPLALVLLAASALSATAQYCTPDECSVCNLRTKFVRCCNEPPELWVIYTRCAPRCCNLDAGFEKLTYQRYDPCCKRFVRESRESFLAAESDRPTLFFSHGNTLKHKAAMKSCWEIYCRMKCCPGPKRLVFWSWPAEVVHKRPLLFPRKLIDKNLKTKFVYAEYQGYYMAKLVNQMSLAQRVTLSGHSYGAITASTAAHWLGGGCLRGLVLEGGASVERPNLRLGMISGAFDNDAMIPGHRYGQAFIAAEAVYVTRNIRDKTLDNWPKVSFWGRPAIGVTGINANCLGVYRPKLCQQTLTSDVGRSHYMGPHLESDRFIASLCCIAFPACTAEDGCPLAMATDGSASEPTDGDLPPIDELEQFPEDLEASTSESSAEDEQFDVLEPFEDIAELEAPLPQDGALSATTPGDPALETDSPGEASPASKPLTATRRPLDQPLLLVR